MRSKGFILFTTISMLSLLTILILAFLKSLSMHIKLSNDIIKSHQEFYSLEDLGLKISNNITAYALKSCVISSDKTILQKSGCKLEYKNSDYYYILNDLGEFPCLKIDVGGVKYSSYHWLISIANNEYPEKVLHLRVATVSKPANCEETFFNNIAEGVISSWVS